jgi:hypothetical protein
MDKNHCGKKRAKGGTFSPLKGICMPSQNHCVCIYYTLDSVRMICVSTKRRGCTRRQSHWMIGSKVGRSSLSASAFLPFFKRRKLTVQEQQSILYGHSPERIDYIYTKAQNLILYFFSYFFLWLTMRGRAVLEKKKDGTGDRIIASHSTNDIKG